MATALRIFHQLRVPFNGLQKCDCHLRTQQWKLNVLLQDHQVKLMILKDQGCENLHV